MSEQDIKMLKDMLTSIMESQTRTELKLENIEGR
jgi:hypothetical protein